MTQIEMDALHYQILYYQRMIDLKEQEVTEVKKQTEILDKIKTTLMLKK